MDRDGSPTRVLARHGSQIHRRADGAKLRRLRQERGWSQEELAHQASLSERLVRKAESSALLRYTTLVRLAKALSKSGCGVATADLAPTVNNILIELVESLFDDSHHELVCAENEYEPALRTFVAGTPDIIPFAGTFHGMAGFAGFRKTLRETLSQFCRQEKTTEWFAESGRFCMCCNVQIAISKAGHPVKSWFTIYSPSSLELNIHFDTELMAQAIQTR